MNGAFPQVFEENPDLKKKSRLAYENWLVVSNIFYVHPYLAK